MVMYRRIAYERRLTRVGKSTFLVERETCYSVGGRYVTIRAYRWVNRNRKTLIHTFADYIEGH